MALKLVTASPASITLPFLILMAAGCGGNDKSASQAPASFPVKVSKVSRGDVPVAAEFVGQTKGSVDAEIRARVEGVITGIHFEDGKEVTEGQLLYTIDSAPFEAKVAEAKAKLAEAQTRLAKAESDLKRIRPLADMKAVSERDLDAAVANEGAARGAVDGAAAGVEAVNIELGYCKITSPTKGIIGISKAKIGEFVGRSPNPVILNTVSNLDPIHVRFSVNEKEYLYFARLKQKALEAGAAAPQYTFELFLADGSQHPQRGAIASAEREIDPKTGTLAVEATFANPHKLIRPGQFAKIHTIADTLSGALLVPKRAIRELQGQYQVFVVKADNTVETRTVTVGAEASENRVVESGLLEGELVVVEGLQRLRAGVLVDPQAG